MWWIFSFAFALALLPLGLFGVDALLRARDAWRRRKQAQGGVYGVVVDRNGQVLGTYVDPLQRPRRASRVHLPGSVWTGSDPSDPTAWAWEGQGPTEQEALLAANRLRYMYVSLLPELRMDGELEESGDVGDTRWG